MRYARLHLLTLFLPLILAVFVVGCGASEADAPAEAPEATAPPPVPVAVAPVQREARPLPVRTTGALAARATTPLAFKVGGVVARILVDEGDRVRAGQTLARLDLTEIAARVREAESALDKAERDLARVTRLFRDSVATRQAKQDAETAVEVAEARAERARFNRRYAVVTAPEGGPILQRRAEEGQLVSPGEPVVVLGATGRGWVVQAGVPDRDVVRLALGDSARVTLDAYPRRPLATRVTQIGDAADPATGTFMVEFAVNGVPEGLALKSGFVAKVDAVPSRADTLTFVPAAALIEGDDDTGIVFTLDAPTAADGAAPDAVTTVRRRTVRLARLLDTEAALATALPPGTHVVTQGGARLRDGQDVRVTRVE
jgi:RND family efflux transporter MFP subunit